MALHNVQVQFAPSQPAHPDSVTTMTTQPRKTTRSTVLAYFRVLRIIAVPVTLNIQAYSGPSSRPFIVGVMLHITYNTSRSRSRSVTPLSIPLASSVFFDPRPIVSGARLPYSSPQPAAVEITFLWSMRGFSASPSPSRSSTEVPSVDGLSIPFEDKSISQSSQLRIPRKNVEGVCRSGGMLSSRLQVSRRAH